MHYVTGLVFTEQMKHVLVVSVDTGLREAPHFHAPVEPVRRWAAVTTEIFPGEAPADAMARGTKEQTGFDMPATSWRPVFTRRRADGNAEVGFAAFSDRLLGDEMHHSNRSLPAHVTVFPLSELLRRFHNTPKSLDPDFLTHMGLAKAAQHQRRPLVHMDHQVELAADPAIDPAFLPADEADLSEAERVRALVRRSKSDTRASLTVDQARALLDSALSTVLTNRTARQRP
ncbi:NUDIX domain-containing protein [Variovorax sp. LT1P1]|uniref:NUDIX domain-containing protein n=1 Tax=Variovorax sp. LT1P1 TaxID=3443730 RepID=UPI003F46165C